MTKLTFIFVLFTIFFAIRYMVTPSGDRHEHGSSNTKDVKLPMNCSRKNFQCLPNIQYRAENDPIGVYRKSLFDDAGLTLCEEECISKIVWSVHSSWERETNTWRLRCRAVTGVLDDSERITKHFYGNSSNTSFLPVQLSILDDCDIVVEYLYFFVMIATLSSVIFVVVVLRFVGRKEGLVSLENKEKTDVDKLDIYEDYSAHKEYMRNNQFRVEVVDKSKERNEIKERSRKLLIPYSGFIQEKEKKLSGKKIVVSKNMEVQCNAAICGSKTEEHLGGQVHNNKKANLEICRSPRNDTAEDSNVVDNECSSTIELPALCVSIGKLQRNSLESETTSYNCNVDNTKLQNTSETPSTEFETEKTVTCKQVIAGNRSISEAIQNGDDHVDTIKKADTTRALNVQPTLEIHKDSIENQESKQTVGTNQNQIIFKTSPTFVKDTIQVDKGYVTIAKPDTNNLKKMMVDKIDETKNVDVKSRLAFFNQTIESNKKGSVLIEDNKKMERLFGKTQNKSVCGKLHSNIEKIHKEHSVLDKTLAKECTEIVATCDRLPVTKSSNVIATDNKQKPKVINKNVSSEANDLKGDSDSKKPAMVSDVPNSSNSSDNELQMRCESDDEVVRKPIDVYHYYVGSDVESESDSEDDVIGTPIDIYRYYASSDDEIENDEEPKVKKKDLLDKDEQKKVLVDRDKQKSSGQPQNLEYESVSSRSDKNEKCEASNSEEKFTEVRSVSEERHNDQACNEVSTKSASGSQKSLYNNVVAKVGSKNEIVIKSNDHSCENILLISAGNKSVEKRVQSGRDTSVQNNGRGSKSNSPFNKVPQQAHIKSLKTSKSQKPIFTSRFTERKVESREYKDVKSRLAFYSKTLEINMKNDMFQYGNSRQKDTIGHINKDEAHFSRDKMQNEEYVIDKTKKYNSNDRAKERKSLNVKQEEPKSYSSTSSMNCFNYWKEKEMKQNITDQSNYQVTSQRMLSQSKNQAFKITSQSSMNSIKKQQLSSSITSEMKEDENNNNVGLTDQYPVGTLKILKNILTLENDSVENPDKFTCQ